MPHKDKDLRKAYHKEQNARNFDRIKEGKKAYAARTSEKRKEYKADYYIKNRDKSRASNLKRKHGLDRDGYAEMYSEQKGKCAICGIFLHPFYKKKADYREILHVDHCHKTGKVRGLLCVDCNLGLGRFNDNKNSLLNAIDYLVRRGGGV